jgi:hypothetical protein
MKDRFLYDVNNCAVEAILLCIPQSGIRPALVCCYKKGSEFQRYLNGHHRISNRLEVLQD